MDKLTSGSIRDHRISELGIITSKQEEGIFKYAIISENGIIYSFSLVGIIEYGNRKIEGASSIEIIMIVGNKKLNEIYIRYNHIDK